MGYYINPPDMSKEDFLKQHGREISVAEAKNFDFASDALPVCWVDKCRVYSRGHCVLC